MSESIMKAKTEAVQATEPYNTDEPEQVKWRSLRLDENLPEVDTLTLRQKGEARAIGERIGDEYAARVDSIRKYLRSLPADDPQRAELTPEEIERRARNGSIWLDKRAEDFTWGDLQAVIEKDGKDAGAIVWQALKAISREGLAAGALSCDAILAGQTPFKLAQYGVIFEGYLRAWEPRNVIEQSMVEMLAQAFVSYNHWLEVANLAAEYSYNAIESQNKRDERWNPPRLTASETIENAMMMADRFNRLFLRTLRQMRDLRRYSVTINNAAQVNIGNQQVNVKE